MARVKKSTLRNLWWSSVSVAIRYLNERLPRYCQFCMIMGHLMGSCDDRNDVQVTINWLSTMEMRQQALHFLDHRRRMTLVRSAASRHRHRKISQPLTNGHLRWYIVLAHFFLLVTTITQRTLLFFNRSLISQF